MGFHLFGRTRRAVSFLVVAALALSVVLALSGSAMAAAFTWDKVSTIGFGLPNPSNNGTIFSLCEYNGWLYAGTANKIDGCMVFRYKSGTTWTRVVGQGAAGTPTGPGFGNANNRIITAMSVYNGKLYAGTTNYTTSAQVWAFNGSTWTRADTTDLAVSCVHKMTVFNGKLYCAVGDDESGSSSGTARIWSFNGTNWSPVSTVGFGSPNNDTCRSMAVYNGKLYAGTYNDTLYSEIWRYESGTTWTQIMGSLPGTPEPAGWGENQEETRSMVVYNGKLYAGTSGSSAKLYQYDGTDWSFAGLARTDNGGQMDTSNDSIRSITVWNGLLYVSTGNDGDGTEVWELNLTRATPWKQVNTDGFGAVPADVTNGANTMVVYGGRLWFGGGAGFSDGAGTGGCLVYRGPGPVYPTWYLAEGTTAWGFSTYISIENPNTAAVHAAITYMTGTGNVSGGTITLPAQSQTTVNPADKLGNQDFSTKVACTEGKAIAVDRTMSWTGQGAASPEGHSSVGVTAPFGTWYLPEGSTNWGFETWLLIQNPNSQKANCTVTYMIEDEDPVTKTKEVPANSRQSYNMFEDIGNKDASIKVESNIPVIPERAMYRNNRREGHDSIGTTTPASDYFLAEGTTDYGFTTYVLVQNPNPSPVDVTINYMTPGGPKPQGAFSMPANSRKTVRVNDIAEVSKTDFSTKVHGSKAIIAERAMYWDNGTGEACHDSIGMASAHTTFYLPDGQSSEGRETYTLIQNPNTSDVQVEISYLTPTGEGNVVKTETIGANSRRTFGMLEHSGITGRAAIMVISKTAGKKIMVERAMYWNTRGAGTDTIGGYSD